MRWALGVQALDVIGLRAPLIALLALVVLVLIVWWTMFSGRKDGDPPRDDEEPR